ncbi:tetratricopeptide repeat protein [Coraliomargarita akajimensis]|uniref:tetratricopeptide repeat protein n=1 Tax=Coraliomargarita akajimensis TaxID=395922 RepID=UPI00030386E0|nr:hypothetical protein [Coraliomargarita akajimensis]
METVPTLKPYKPPAQSFELKEALPVRVHIDGNPQLLLGMQGGQLRLVFADRPNAEVLMPLTAPGLFLSYPLPADYTDLLLWEESGDAQRIVDAMAGYAEPLIHFLMIEPERCNFHPICFRYLRALVDAGKLEHAIGLTLQMPLAALNESNQQAVIDLLQAALEAENYPAVTQLLSLLAAVQDPDSYAVLAFAAADHLRAAGQWELAVEVYGSVARVTGLERQTEALLYLAYSALELNHMDEASRLLEQMEQGSESTRTVLRSLVLGRQAMLQGDADRAIHLFSYAMLKAPHTAAYKAELYYYLVHAYRAQLKPQAAAHLSREFALFFPTSIWLERLDALQTSNQDQP